MNLKELKIGYVPYLPDLSQPADRRRFPFFAKTNNVPFEIANSPSLGGRASVRKFLFARGEDSMVDFMTVENDALVDYLGTHKRYRATFAGSVSDGSLLLTSTSVATRILGAWVRLPLHVHLTEQWTGENQRVAVTLVAPVVGRIYEYTGSFSYEVCDD